MKNKKSACKMFCCLTLCCAIALSMVSCGSAKKSHAGSVSAASDSGLAASMDAAASPSAAPDSGGPPAATSAPGGGEGEAGAASSVKRIMGSDGTVIGTSTYTCNFWADRQNFDASRIDITVGDNLYATQINDWYSNMADYVGKTVEIEGYYIDFAPYTLVGRYGPSCPYCQGGYVSFEFLSDQDSGDLVSGESWIKVQGILREYTDPEWGPGPYIEAIRVEKMDTAGIDTVTN